MANRSRKRRPSVTTPTSDHSGKHLVGSFAANPRCLISPTVDGQDGKRLLQLDENDRVGTAFGPSRSRSSGGAKCSTVEVRFESKARRANLPLSGDSRHHPAAMTSQGRHVGEVLFALGDAAPVACLVFGADEAVWRATPQRLAIDVCRRMPDDVLDMGPNLLSSEQGPSLLVGVG